jgi:hypothetical protein
MPETAQVIFACLFLQEEQFLYVKLKKSKGKAPVLN